MQRKFDRLSTIYRSRAILIIRVDDTDRAYDIARAAVDGGMRAIEVTLTMPGALKVIERLASEFSDDVLVGAGTVLDGYAAFAAISAGAGMLVSPQLNPEMLRVARRYQVVSISGALSPTEITDTICEGADLVKLFPSELHGPAYLKSVLAPLAPMPVVPTGGVTAENVSVYFEAGAAAVAIGSYVTKHGSPASGYKDVTAAAARMMAAIENSRKA